MYAKKFLNNVGEEKKKDANTIITEITKGTMVGATIGGGLGLLIGLTKQKNILLSVLIGSVVGGLVSKVFINKQK
jgi:hypothetical protein